MSDYISKDDVLGLWYLRLSDKEIYTAIHNMPSADVRFNIHGRWLNDGFCGDYVCSACKHEIDSDIPNMRGFDFNLPKFCPNCGADMRERVEQ